jgi:hypothetical protein
LSKYASQTSVSVEKSKMEIEQIVRRYGATGFASGWQGTRASLQFVIANRHVRFVMELPDANDKKFMWTESRHQLRSKESALAAWEQSCRQKWRALALLVKAKLEAVDAKIATIEEAFFADIVMSDGRTVYERTREAVALEYQTGQPIKLLGGPNG